MNGFAVRADGRGCRAVDSVDQLLDGEIFSAEYPTLAVASADVLMLIANERFKREEAGIVVQGLAIQTDRSSQAKLTRAAVRASRDISYLIHWKQENGAFVQLDAYQVQACDSAVDAYVQACFIRESELVAAVNAGVYEAKMLETGWPAIAFSAVPDSI
ncbi:DUF4376 domain-containing protein [Pseudomonas protegens]|uniref:DUF4376 domain-containing protein n=1 Tax=Pseudomonas TaxID=286 RepID=UPI00137357F4|nr:MULTISPECIES: DUF4376 domain-containing protein [Pseudomonas]NMZ29013.1 DUF4376 domain-containing protein [Pseudomonas protegens]NMZ88619.1 DUF4376 domain-containing protein [Pseudomonas protegens]